MTEAPPRAAIYCRMSLARFGDTTKIEDQERICRELCKTRGWEIADVYGDNNRSAWQRNRKRPGWDRMLADVGGGEIGAIVVYHGDRLVRQPFDLETLLNLADGKGIQLASPTGTRDLANDDDLFILRIEVAAACRESAATSRRKKGEYQRMRRAGLVRPGGRGGRAYGFATDGVTHLPADHCSIATREEVIEADVVREVTARVLGGEPTLAIARDLTARGERTPAGGPFTHGTLRKMLARPRYAGLMPDGIHPAAWQPVLDRETWEAACAVLDARAAGFGYATNARKHLLSGIARCGECGTGLQIRVEQRRTHLTGYGCVQPGCRKVQRSVALLEEYVITRVIARLGNPGNPQPRIPRNAAAAGEYKALTMQRAEAELLAEDPAKGPHLPLLLRRIESIDRRLAEMRQLAAGDARVRLRSSRAGITREEFDALPLATRRALIAACFTVTVLPASRRGPGFNTGDVRLVPR